MDRLKIPAYGFTAILDRKKTLLYSLCHDLYSPPIEKFFQIQKACPKWASVISVCMDPICSADSDTISKFFSPGRLAISQSSHKDLSWLTSDRGVQLYRKDYPNGNPDFVQVIDLDLGARLELMHGEITEARPYKGDYGGPDPRMTSLLMETYWERLNQTDEKAFCVTNGLFFYMPEYPTRLAFPLKIDGQLVTDGWGKETHIGEQLLLELWDDHASISPLSEAGLKMSTAPNLIGGLTEEANKRLKYSVGRTFFGID